MITIAFLISSTALALAIGYAALLVLVIRTWRNIPESEITPDWRPKTRISVLIPARNESAGIRACLASVLEQSYPTDLTEVIVIDDHSEDETARIVASIRDSRLQLLRLADFPEYVLPNQALKKQAISLGVDRANGDLIVCTDADCAVPREWLRRIAFYFEQKGCRMVAGPVAFAQETNLLECFQSLDYLGMMLLTAAGIESGWFHLSNGANLAYSREVFLAVGGFADNRHLGSGDDWLLSLKIAALFPGEIGFVKHPAATVQTLAMPTFGAFIRQRRRWASKSGVYRQWRLLAMQGLTFLMCWSLLLGLLVLPWAGMAAMVVLLTAWGVKSGADYFFLQEATKYFDRKDLMRSFIPAQFLHVLYFAGAGVSGLFFRHYEWKGRVSR